MDLFDVYQHYQISNANQAAGDASRSARSARNAQQYLAAEVARLGMVTEAIWNLVKEKTNLTDEDLMAAVAQLDLSDGVADGKKQADGPLRCPECDRANSRRHEFCIYCGSMLRTTPFQ